jgi:hypothetical protein
LEAEGALRARLAGIRHGFHLADDAAAHLKAQVGWLQGQRWHLISTKKKSKRDYVTLPVVAVCSTASVPHHGSFWLHDPDQLCYQGYHKAWALGLGLPLLLLVCGLLPAAILWVALRSKHRLTDPVSVSNYGFLIRSYKPANCWWEAAVLFQVAVLTAVWVFSYSLRPMAAWVMNLTPAAVVVLLLVRQPYAHPEASHVMLSGVYCLLLTSLDYGRSLHPKVSYLV